MKLNRTTQRTVEILKLVSKNPEGITPVSYTHLDVYKRQVSGVCCLIFMIKRFELLRMTKEEAKPDRDILLALCNMGVPMGLQYSITAIGSVVLQTAVNGLGSMAVAAVTAGTKISMFFCCPFDALGSTMATYGGQNIGARKLDRISRGLKAASVMGLSLIHI